MSSEIQPYQQSAAIDLSAYDPRKYNVLVPTVMAVQVNPLYQIRLVEVRADPDPNHGDVFKVGSRQEKGSDNKWHTINVYSPQKPLIERLANAAGIVFSPTETRLVKRTPRYAYYYAVGARRMPSGEWAVAVGSKEIDLDVIEDELRLQYEQKCEDAGYDAPKKYAGEWVKDQLEDNAGKPYTKNRFVIAEDQRDRYVSDMLRAVMIQWRKNLVPRVETGARLRVIRSLLGMKSTCTADELANPFIIATVDFAPDYRDQQIKRMAIQQGLQAMGALYRGGPTIVPETVFEGTRSVPEAVDEDYPEILDETTQTEGPTTAPAEEPGETEPNGEPAGAEEEPQTEPEPEHKSQPKTTKPPTKPAPPTQTEQVVKCQHKDCGKPLSVAEQGYSSRMCTGMYCVSHQRLHKKAGG